MYIIIYIYIIYVCIYICIYSCYYYVNVLTCVNNDKPCSLFTQIVLCMIVQILCCSMECQICNTNWYLFHFCLHESMFESQIVDGFWSSNYKIRSKIQSQIEITNHYIVIFVTPYIVEYYYWETPLYIRIYIIY